MEKWKTQSLIFKMFHHERRFIQFIVLARCRIWPPLDGAAHRFKKKSNMPSFSFTPPVKDVSQFLFLSFTLILLLVQKKYFIKYSTLFEFLYYI